MRRHTLLLTLGMLLMIGIAWGADDEHSHAAGSHRTIVVGSDQISPAPLTMSRDDVLEFENFAFNPMMVVFVEPKDQADKIRCHLVKAKGGSAGKAPWLLFDWNPQKQLTAIIPPGRFASVCSFAPGQYTFVAKPAPRVASAPAEPLGMKGTIVVQ